MTFFLVSSPVGEASLFTLGTLSAIECIPVGPTAGSVLLITTKEDDIMIEAEPQTDEFARFSGLICSISTVKHKIPLNGRVIEVSAEFLTIERKSGEIVLIRKAQIQEMRVTLRQPKSNSTQKTPPSSDLA